MKEHSTPVDDRVNINKADGERRKTRGCAKAWKIMRHDVILA